MNMDVLGRWIRGVFSIAVVVAAVLMIRQWYVDLPRAATRTDRVTSQRVVTPLRSPGERIGAWRPGSNRPTWWLAGGLALLFFTFAGRFVSPLAWRRSGPRPHATPRRVHVWKTSHGPLEVEEHGPEDAPPLLLVHGLSSDRTQWLETLADLGHDHRLFVFDLPGHGREARTWKRDAFTIAAGADVLDEVVRRIGAEDLVVLGHSMGGMIAMHWWGTRRAGSRRIAGMVLAHTTPRNPFTTMAPVGLHRALVPVYDAWLRVVPALSPLVSILQRIEYWNGSIHWQNDLQGFAGTETREELDRTARIATRMAPDAGATFTRSMIRFEARSQVRSVGVPVLVVAGDRDRITLPEASREIADRAPHARLVTLGNARHLGYMERRRHFAEAVAHFVEDLRGGRSERVARSRA